MGYFTSSSALKLILPILFFLFPALLRYLTFCSSSTKYSSGLVATDIIKKSMIVSAENVDAPRTFFISENKFSSSIMKDVKKSPGPIEQALTMARAAIRRAALAENASENGTSYLNELSLPSIFRNPAAFYRSYSEMEKRLKIYIYEEGEAPLVHDGPCKNIYTIEGRFIQELEMMKGRFRTKDPTKANVFFLPFSIAWMVQYVYNETEHDQVPIQVLVSNYINFIAAKHPFWNRTAGADHFMLSCHDWGPKISRGNIDLFRNSIRALCNANTSEGFKPYTDVSVPEIHLLNGDLPEQLLHPPPSSTKRPYLAFFAGGPHGRIRSILQEAWGAHQDPLIQVHEYLPKNVDYYGDYMLKSRFCLCPSGYEVASARVVEAIMAECVPVLIKKGYIAPFSDVLKWEEFSMKVKVENVGKLKEILEAVTEVEMERLREGVRAVRRHFVLNQPVERFDVFHMILHSIWLRRLNVGIRTWK